MSGGAGVVISATAEEREHKQGKYRTHGHLASKSRTRDCDWAFGRYEAPARTIASWPAADARLASASAEIPFEFSSGAWTGFCLANRAMRLRFVLPCCVLGLGLADPPAHAGRRTTKISAAWSRLRKRLGRSRLSDEIRTVIRRALSTGDPEAQDTVILHYVEDHRGQLTPPEIHELAKSTGTLGGAHEVLTGTEAVHAAWSSSSGPNHLRRLP
jgi:hypothetical protein